ncbi:MAG: hypothetical protein RMJ75_02385 [Nitrososphaerota archaeon]|nr:hypothetical protein [Nitrososphaerota archaeon]
MSFATWASDLALNGKTSLRICCGTPTDTHINSVRIKRSGT